MLLVGVLDLVLNFPGYCRWKFSDALRNILKILLSLAWTIALPLLYIQSWPEISIPVKYLDWWLPEVKGIQPLYVMAVMLYMLPNMLGGILFIFPMIRRWIENSDWHIIRLLLWWSQVPSLVISKLVFIKFFIIVKKKNFVVTNQ